MYVGRLETLSLMIGVEECMYTLTVVVPAHVYSREHVCERVDYSLTPVGLGKINYTAIISSTMVAK